MNIQYGNMNPFRELQSGIATGLQLGNMAAQRRAQQEKKKEKEKEGERPSGYKIELPQRKIVKMGDFIQQERADYETIKKYYDKTKDMDTEQKIWIYNDLMKSGSIKSQSMKELAGSVSRGDVTEKEINETLKSIKQNSPNAQADLDVLLNKLGTNSPASQAIQSKVGEAQALQNQYDQEYAFQLKMTLQTIASIRDNPRQFEGENGIMDPSTATVISNEKQYAIELMRMGGDNAQWVKDFYLKQQEKRTGYKPETWKGKLPNGKTVYGTGTVESFQRKHPGVTNIEPLQKMTELERFMENQKFKKRKSRVDELLE